eukprot:11232232-Ditylum_brightwellii.AAC.1
MTMLFMDKALRGDTAHSMDKMHGTAAKDTTHGTVEPMQTIGTEEAATTAVALVEIITTTKATVNVVSMEEEVYKRFLPMHPTLMDSIRTLHWKIMVDRYKRRWS